MLNNVVFRVDAHPGVGLGHVARCLALAHELRKLHANVVFICQDRTDSAMALVEKEGFKLSSIPCGGGDLSVANIQRWSSEALQIDAWATIEKIKEIGGADWLVVDHYSLDENWECKMRTVCRQILAIDDLLDRIHDCNVLLNQNIGFDSTYARQIPTSGRPLMGPHWALLRNEFVVARSNLKRRTGEVSRILISFGGGDPTGETLKALIAIDSSEVSDLELDVVVGSVNSYRPQVEALCQKLPRATYHHHSENMAQLMARCDLAFGAGGTSALERLSVGLPAIVVAVAANQFPIMQNLHNHGLAIGLGVADDISSEDYSKALIACIQAPEELLVMSERCLSTVDGFGAHRVALELERLN